MVQHFVTILLAAVIIAAAQPLQYSLLPAGSTAPAGRLDGTIVHDPVGRQLFLFGGLASGARNDLWVYSLERKEWRELQPAGARPVARWGHAMVLDETRRRLVMFGGQASGFFNDLWTYDIVEGTWTQAGQPGEGPSRRYGHSAIFEPGRDRVIISHGFTDAGRFDDTWAYEFGPSRWRDISPRNNRPLRRCLHHAVYDAMRGQMLLYGGCASGFGPCPLGDLWAFDLAKGEWAEQVASPAPAPRQYYGRSYDVGRDRMILFGGSGRGSLSDTWEFNPGLRQWREAVLEGPAPSARFRHESAYGEGITYFFGGSTEQGLTNELWQLGPRQAAASAVTAVVNAFDGSPGAVVPGGLVSIYGSGLGNSVSWNGLLSTVLYTDAGQINAQVPEGLAGAVEARLVVGPAGGVSAAVTLPVAAARVGLFPRAWNQDGGLNGRENPAGEGEIVVVYATGHGQAAGAAVTVGGRTAEVLYAGVGPGTIGVMQINLRIPTGTGGGEAVPVIVRVEESTATLPLAVRP